jgi:hypothetical protein
LSWVTKPIGRPDTFIQQLITGLPDGTITRIRTIVPGGTLLYSVMQNAGRSYATGLDIVLSQDITKLFSFNLNLNGYHNRLNAYTVTNKYPQLTTLSYL